MNWANYFFGTDFTGVSEFLLAVPEGEISKEDGVGLAAFMSERDTQEGKSQWCYADPVTAFNLKHATVIYNGTNDNHLPTNALYQNVLILEFAPECESPAGRIYLQYN